LNISWILWLWTAGIFAYSGEEGTAERTEEKTLKIRNAVNKNYEE